MKVTARERSQRYRRKMERAAGKPKRGRPRGSRTILQSFREVRGLYQYLVRIGQSPASAIATVRRELGETLTVAAVQSWREKGQLLPGKLAKVPVETPEQELYRLRLQLQATILLEVNNHAVR